MKEFAKDIQCGDVFVVDGKENVAIDSYTLGSPFLWVTNREFFINTDCDDCVYGYTSACIIELSNDTLVKYLGNMKE